MPDREDVLEATDVLVRDVGIAQAERDLQERIKHESGIEQRKALAALAALRRGEVGDVQPN